MIHHKSLRFPVLKMMSDQSAVEGQQSVGLRQSLHLNRALALDLNQFPLQKEQDQEHEHD